MTDVIHLDDIRDVPTTQDTPERQSSWQPANLVTLAANPPEPPSIGGILYPGQRTVLSGETESMKTWFALILCKAELELGLPVAWVDLDAMGPGAMLDRLRLLGVDDQTIQDGFLYYEPDRPLDERHTQPLAETIADRGIRVCVIDAFNPILAMHGLDFNSTTDIEKFWQLYADPICDAGAAPVMLDHVVKNAENRGKYAIGAERKASGAGIHLGFKLLEPLRKGGTGRSIISVFKDRPGYLPRPSIGRLVIDATDSQISYQVEPDKSHDEHGFRPTVLMEKVSDWLQRYGSEASRNAVEEGVVGKRDGIRAALEILTSEGYIERREGPRRAQLFTHLKPYSEEADTTPQTTPPLRPALRPDFALNLRSKHAFDFAPAPPYGGEGRSQCAEPPNFASTSPRELGETILEYDYPPLDESLAPDPDDDHGEWFR